MRKGFNLSVLLLSLTMGVNSYACDQHNSTGIVEENDLYISADQKSFVSNIDEKLFNEIIDKAEEIYAPIIAEKGKQLAIARNWEDGTVNAYAQQTGNVWKVAMFGGLARHETITADAFATVVCHELGHHLGGTPKVTSWFGGTTWASNEGQADYWGTSKCLRKYMENDDNISIVESMEIPSIVSQKCEASFTTAEEVAMCKRGAMAGQSLGNLFRVLRKQRTAIKFTTPDTKIVASTNHRHPAPQCRLDTYFMGSVCEVDAYEDTSNIDETKGTCTRVNNFEDGLRPLCWFKPKSTDIGTPDEEEE